MVLKNSNNPLLILNLFFICTFAQSSPAHFNDSSIIPEQTLISKGFVDIQKNAPDIKIDLKYAQTNNFTGLNIYDGFERCYLHKKAFEKLQRANILLKEKHPELSLLVVDGFRPRKVQSKLWEFVKGTSKQNYIANPKSGSMHNFGFAVDITLIDNKGKRLDMGTPVDSFGPLSEPRKENFFLKKGKLTPEQIKNRLLLRKVMTQAGFLQLPIEWWHFDAFATKIIRKNYKIID